MKTLVGLAVVSLGLLLMSGCASTGTAYEKSFVPQDQIEVDGRYVGLVEAIAKQRGTRVMWVNKPMKRTTGTVASSD